LGLLVRKVGTQLVFSFDRRPAIVALMLWTTRLISSFPSDAVACTFSN